MKFNLSPMTRHSSFMGHSSSQPKQPGPQFHVGASNPDAQKHRSANIGSQWEPSSLAAPPPYTSVAAEIHSNEHAGRSSAAARPPRATETFASPDRLRDIAYLQAPMRRESKENALEMLRAYDTVVIMDDSTSMRHDNRWEQACDALSQLAEIATTYDRDGIDIHFLNYPRSSMNVKDPKRVRQLFRHVQPHGYTPIANKLDILVGDYIEKLESAARRKKKGDLLALKQIKPVNFIVITDGAPTDEPLDSILSLARRLDRGNFPLAQVGIQFVQIGNDKEATEFLKQLDDDLSGAYGVRDIVDTTPFLGINLTAEMLLKILLGGINRRVDRRGAEGVMSS